MFGNRFIHSWLNKSWKRLNKSFHFLSDSNSDNTRRAGGGRTVDNLFGNDICAECCQRPPFYQGKPRTTHPALAKYKASKTETEDTTSGPPMRIVCRTVSGNDCSDPGNQRSQICVSKSIISARPNILPVQPAPSRFYHRTTGASDPLMPAVGYCLE